MKSLPKFIWEDILQLQRITILVENIFATFWILIFNIAILTTKLIFFPLVLISDIFMPNRDISNSIYFLTSNYKKYNWKDIR
jgi:hypothetical protein